MSRQFRPWTICLVTKETAKEWSTIFDAHEGAVFDIGRGATRGCRHRRAQRAVSAADSSLKATTVFLTLSRLSDEGAKVPAGDIMANGDVRLGIRKNARRRDGTAERRLDRAAQCGLADATQARK